MAANKLEEAANAARNALIPMNNYNSKAPANEYSQTHSRALSDQETPIHGKGTGVFMDTYNGGGDVDINGNGVNPGSGRINNLVTNQYNNTNHYRMPDLTNSGISIID